MNDAAPAPRAHWTARRGFIAAAGFGMVSLYLLWAFYGAAPLGFGEHDHGEAVHADEAGGHGGHGAAPAQEVKAQIEEFRGQAERFVEQHKLRDSSVRPARLKPAPLAPKPEARGHASDGHSHAKPHDDHGGAQEEASAAQEEGASEAGPIDVYLMAYQFGFLPAVLHLEAGVPSRFRMMAVDVAHGASVRVGPGARVVRLRPGVLVEQELTFQRAGEHLLYCTVYCGLAHDRMQGKIVVTERSAGS